MLNQSLFRISLNNFLHLQKITIIEKEHHSIVDNNCKPKQTTYL